MSLDHSHLQPDRLHIPGRVGAVQELTAGPALPLLAGPAGLVHDAVLHLAHTGLRCLPLHTNRRPHGLGEAHQDLLCPRRQQTAQVQQQGSGHHFQDVGQRNRALIWREGPY